MTPNLRNTPVIRLLLAAFICVTASSVASAQNYLVVANKQAASASVIDLSSGSTVKTVPVGNGPHEVAISHSQTFAAVSNYGAQAPGNSITIIDLGKLEPVKTIDLGKYTRPHGMSFLPGDSLLAITSEATQAVVVFSLTTGQLVEELPTKEPGSHMLSVTSKADKIYTANVGSGTVSELTVGKPDAMRTLKVALKTEGIGILPDGSQVWMGCNTNHKVYVIDTQSWSVIDSLDAPGLPYRINISPDGQNAVVSTPMNGRVLVFDVASRNLRKALEIPFDSTRVVHPSVKSAMPVGGTISLDGKKAYIALQGYNEAAVIDLQNLTVDKYLKTGAGPDGIGVAAMKP